MNSKSLTQLSIDYDVCVQFGSEKIPISMDSTFNDILTVAYKLVKSQYPVEDCDYIKSVISMYLYSYENPKNLILLNENFLPEINKGDKIFVLLKDSKKDNEKKQTHVLSVCSFQSPTFCDICHVFMNGIVKQGLNCSLCQKNYHKRCIINDTCQCFGKKLHNEPQDDHITGLPHTFVLTIFKKATSCSYCKKHFKGLFRKVMMCTDCNFVYHKKCVQSAKKNCQVKPETTQYSLMEDDEEYQLKSESDSEEKIVTDKMSDDVNMMTIAENLSNIPLMRVTQSIKKKKQNQGETIHAGWMYHHSEDDSTIKKHYWKLNTSHLIMYHSDLCSRYYKEYKLTTIVRIKINDVENANKTNSFFIIELHDASRVFVGVYRSSQQNLDTSILHREYIKGWYTSIQNQILPLLNVNIPTIKLSNKEFQYDTEETISNDYKIDATVILGSGQFGIVYGGSSNKTLEKVAIKVICKNRFTCNQADKLKNEVRILTEVNYEGVIRMEGFYETENKIFIMMEQLHGDMLDMILNHKKGRLNERITSYLTAQILLALRYLHSLSIVHCDLKPENVLLSNNVDFPQIKLCDFGFARIMGINSFRRSLVGTPAYLAPEAVKKKKYNRSIDLWSVGVIIYVSLSATFPFNVDEDITEQIKNASFLFPSDTWKNISCEAIDLIKHLLTDKIRLRFVVNKALFHPWVHNYLNFSDLRRLEEQINKRYLTDETYDDVWEQYRLKNNLPPWKEYNPPL